MAERCNHTDLDFDLKHVPLGDSNVHFVEVTAHCRGCRRDMIFQGVPFGMSPMHPTVNPCRSQVYLPMLGPGESIVMTPPQTLTVLNGHDVTGLKFKGNS